VDSPLATIIVVSFNSRRWLARMCAALQAQTERRWRLVLLDNASKPEERPRQEDLPAGATLIQSEENLGFAAGNNRAARGATTPYLVFLNPDAFPAPDWLAQLIATAERFADAAAIGSTQIRADDENTFDGTGDVLHASGIAYRSNYGRPRTTPPPLGESFAACGAAMLVRREAFEAVGGFDERYFCYFEDVDLGFRLRLAGWRILQSPDAIVAHVGGGVAGARNAFTDFHGARNRTWTFIKCMPSALLWPLMPVYIASSLLVMSVASLRGRGFASWRGMVSAFGRLGPVLQTRRTLQAQRRAHVGDIARMLAWNPLVLISRKPVIRPLAPASPPTGAPVRPPA